jgi:hypothetical protein
MWWIINEISLSTGLVEQPRCFKKRIRFAGVSGDVTICCSAHLMLNLVPASQWCEAKAERKLMVPG